MPRIRHLLALLVFSLAIGAVTSTVYMGCSTRPDLIRANSEWHAKRTADAHARLKWELGTGAHIYHAKLAALHAAICFVAGVPFCLKPPT